MKALLTHSYTKYVAIVLGALLSIGIVTAVVYAETTGAQYVQDGPARGYVDVTNSVGPSAEWPAFFAVRGWAFDAAVSNEGIEVRVLDESGEVVETVPTVIPRSDVQGMYPEAPLTSGFAFDSPPRYNDGNSHTFSFWTQSSAGPNVWQFIGDATMTPSDAGVAGSLDGIVNNAVIGWAVDLDDRFLHLSQIPVAVYIDGDFIASDVARLQRPDVEDALIATYPQIGEFHGYNVAIPQSYIPTSLKDDRIHRVEVFALEVSEGTMASVGVDWYYISPDGLLYQLVAETQ